LQGIRNAVPLATQVLFTPGCPLVTEEIPLAEPVPPACFYTDATRRVHGLNATYYRSVFSTDRAVRTRIDAAVDLAFPDQSAKDSLPYAEGFYVKWTGILVPPATGDYQIGFAAKDAFRLTVDDKLIVDEWYQGNRRSSGNTMHLDKNIAYRVLIEHAHPGVAGPASAPAGGGANPSYAPAAPRDTAFVQLKWTRPAPDGTAAGATGMPLFSDAIHAAQAADSVVLVLGITADLEREEASVHYDGFSGGDRTSLDLPAVQERLLEAVTAAAAGKPVALVLTSGSALSINWANDHVPAIVQAWYPGQHGDAVADVLFGDYNPAGRLPVTFYKSVDDLPAFTNYAMDAGGGRTYRYFKGPVLYPFGYGLSYTKFAYSNLTVTPNPSTTEDVIVWVAVKNTGPVAGDEVVQVYVENSEGPAMQTASSAMMPPPAGATPPVAAGALTPLFAAALPPKALVGFKRIALKPGEEKTLEFTITPHQLGAALSENKRTNIARTITVQAAPNSNADAGVSQKVVITGNPAEADYRFVAPKVLEPAVMQP